jgi:hypothetical protein
LIPSRPKLPSWARFAHWAPCVVALGLACALSQRPAFAASDFALQWDPVPYEVACYKVFAGRSPGQYALAIFVPAVRLPLSAVDAGTYYFAVSAITPDGRESPKSRELIVEIAYRNGELRISYGDSGAGWNDAATDLRLDRPTYGTGDVPKITALAITNRGEARTVAWRMWARLPDGTDLPILRIDALRLEPEQTLDFISGGEAPLMALSSTFPPGRWSLVTEISEMTTGRVIRADVVSFRLIQPSPIRPSWSIEEIDGYILLFDALRVERRDVARMK